MSHRPNSSSGPPNKQHSGPRSSSNNQQGQGRNRAGPSTNNGGTNNVPTINKQQQQQQQNGRMPIPVMVPGMMGGGASSSSSPSPSPSPHGPATTRKSPLLSQSPVHHPKQQQLPPPSQTNKPSLLSSPNKDKSNPISDENNAVQDFMGGGGGGGGILIDDDDRQSSSTIDQLLNGSTDSSESDDANNSATTSINALPDNVLENLFTFLELKDVISVSAVCAVWQRVISDENGDVWRSLCLKQMDRETLNSDLLVTCPTFKGKLRSYFHAWNPQDCSRNIYVKPNGFTIHRNPVAQSTDGARGKIGFSRGRHAWEVKWEGPLGTVAVVGVATHDADLRTQGYIALLGKDEKSWGWNLVENVLLHNGDSLGNYPLVNNAPRYQVGEKIRVILDCEDNTLSFEKNEEFLGVAFRGLPQHEPLYPAVSAVYGNSEISMVYLGPPLDG